MNKNSGFVSAETIFLIFACVAAIVYFSFLYRNNGRIVVIDKCQYIKSWNGHSFNLTHKGNCTNIIHNTKYEK